MKNIAKIFSWTVLIKREACIILMLFYDIQKISKQDLGFICYSYRCRVDSSKNFDERML
jgi:hypothetical protein